MQCRKRQLHLRLPQQRRRPTTSDKTCRCLPISSVRSVSLSIRSRRVLDQPERPQIPFPKLNSPDPLPTSSQLERISRSSAAKHPLHRKPNELPPPAQLPSRGPLQPWLRPSLSGPVGGCQGYDRPMARGPSSPSE